MEVELLDHLLRKYFQAFQYFQKTGIIIYYRPGIILLREQWKNILKIMIKTCFLKSNFVNLISSELKFLALIAGIRARSICENY